MTRWPFLRRSFAPAIITTVAAAAALSLVAAGCGGSAGSHGAQVGSATQSPALAFARCMRAHGVPNWPDPTSSGAFDKTKLRQLGVRYSRIRALQDGPCNIPLPSPQEQTISPADHVYYLRAAACMRSHGVPNFPDPTFQSNTVRFQIPAGIDANSSQFTSARASCVRLIPPGLPYSQSGSP